MRPYALVSVDFIQKIEDSENLTCGLIAGDPSAFGSHDQRHQSESRASGCENIVLSASAAFEGHTRGGVGPVGKVVEGLVLPSVEQLANPVGAVSCVVFLDDIRDLVLTAAGNRAAHQDRSNK